MEFTIVFWNIWMDAQMPGVDSAIAKSLLSKLDEIIEQYRPDCIGLNEVLQETKTKRHFVLEHLKKRGYSFQHFAYASPLNSTWEIGAALVSRHPIKDIDEIVMGNDTFATWRGYKGHTVKAIGARVQLSAKKSVQVVVAHPLALKPPGLREHWRNQAVLRETVRKPRYKQLIIGGDFNEPNHIPMTFAKREKERFHARSGHRKQPTWSHHGQMSLWLRCNLDKIFWTKEKSTQLLEFKVLDSFPSDHSPLLGRFTL